MKLHEATQMFMMVDDVREMALKKSCKYGEYGSFEHLLFLFVMLMLLVQFTRIFYLFIFRFR